MARNYPADVYQQKAMEERYTKENDSQLAYYVKLRDAGKGGELTKSKQMEVMRRKLDMAPKMSGEMDELNAKRTGPKLRPKMNLDDELLEKLKDASGEVRLEEMRPASCKTKKLLYDGFSHEGKGRVQYLKARTTRAPESKFVYPVLNSMEYGWKLSEVVKVEEIKKPPHCRTKVINDTFYTRTGIPIKHGDGMLTKSTMF